MESPNKVKKLKPKPKLSLEQLRATVSRKYKIPLTDLGPEVSGKTRNLPEHIESKHCIHLTQWAGLAQGTMPGLEWLHHIPNGGARSAFEGKIMKGEGVKAGVWDFNLPVVSIIHCTPGMYIEMKKPGLENTKRGGLSDKQYEFGEHIHEQGYVCVVAYHWLQAQEAISAYYKPGDIPHRWKPKK